MKQITFIAAFLVAFGMNAQIFSEDFETYTATDNVGEQIDVPPGYINYDVDGDGFGWGLSNPANFSQPFGDIYTGNFIISASYITLGAGGNGGNGALSPDNILVLPQISIPAGATDVTLSFYAGSGTDPSFFSETYDVIVSLADDQASVLAGDVIFTETLSFQGGEFKGPFTLDAYVGQDIFISFRHRDTTDEWLLGIDNIVVDGTLSTIDNAIAGFNFFYNVQNKNLTIQANDAFNNISIFNILGQEVIAKNLSSTNEVISLASLKDGIYIANVTANGQTTSFKVVKR